jgi:hypothetical protein
MTGPLETWIDGQRFEQILHRLAGMGCEVLLRNEGDRLVPLTPPRPSGRGDAQDGGRDGEGGRGTRKNGM